MGIRTRHEDGIIEELNSRLGVAGRLKEVGAGTTSMEWFWAVPGRAKSFADLKAELKKAHNVCPCVPRRTVSRDKFIVLES